MSRFYNMLSFATNPDTALLVCMICDVALIFAVLLAAPVCNGRFLDGLDSPVRVGDVLIGIGAFAIAVALMFDILGLAVTGSPVYFV